MHYFVFTYTVPFKKRNFIKKFLLPAWISLYRTQTGICKLERFLYLWEYSLIPWDFKHKGWSAALECYNLNDTAQIMKSCAFCTFENTSDRFHEILDTKNLEVVLKCLHLNDTVKIMINYASWELTVSPGDTSAICRTMTSMSTFMSLV